MSEEKEKVVPVMPATGLQVTPGSTVVKLGDVLEELGLGGPQVPAEELVDATFVIYGAKPFQSAFQEQTHAYFCRCADPKTGEAFTTVLGGGAVVELLDIYIASGADRPLQVTLRQKEGGRFGRYYVIE